MFLKSLHQTFAAVCKKKNVLSILFSLGIWATTPSCPSKPTPSLRWRTWRSCKCVLCWNLHLQILLSSLQFYFSEPCFRHWMFCYLPPLAGSWTPPASCATASWSGFLSGWQSKPSCPASTPAAPTRRCWRAGVCSPSARRSSCAVSDAFVSPESGLWKRTQIKLFIPVLPDFHTSWI